MGGTHQSPGASAAHDTEHPGSGAPVAHPSVVTPGNYDGVHLGHRLLVERARRRADGTGGAARVLGLTFDPHPNHFVSQSADPPLLTSPERRAELLREAGADAVHVQRFDGPFAGQSPEAFVRDFLVGELGARGVVVGSDFRFGARRAGDVARLTELGAPLGMAVEVVEPVMRGGEPVSSSRVRSALAEGDVLEAAAMLTRVHDVTRRVVPGASRGKSLGFPTANLELSGFMLPADGVYAVAARVVGEANEPVRAGVANLGVRPTLEAGRSVEVHLLDFDGDLYDRELRVGFVARLRGERRFDSVDALRAQIATDVAAGREAFEAVDARLLRCL